MSDRFGYLYDAPGGRLLGFKVLDYSEFDAEAADVAEIWGEPLFHYQLGRFPEAYRHLRHYTEIAPHGSWNCCWFGKGAEAVGEREEAIAAYERALELLSIRPAVAPRSGIWALVPMRSP